MTKTADIGDIFIDSQGTVYERWANGWKDKKTGKFITRERQAQMEKDYLDNKSANPFRSIRTLRDIDQSAAFNSYSWLQRQVKKLGSVGRNPAQLMSQNVKLTSKMQFGSMYLFNYDAKHKDTLPYWDQFPLVFPFQPAAGGFLGLNIHYIPYAYRLRLLDKLFDFATTDGLEHNTRVMFSWGMLMESTKFTEVKSCVKHYLTDHVHSNFMYVDPRDWYTAAMMPIDRFVGAGKGTVWKHSMGRK